MNFSAPPPNIASPQGKKSRKSGGGLDEPPELRREMSAGEKIIETARDQASPLKIMIMVGPAPAVMRSM